MVYAGNLAGEGLEVCRRLVAMGAVGPLARLLLQAVPSRGRTASDSAAATAAWALSNLLWSVPSVVSAPGSCSICHAILSWRATISFSWGL